MKRFLLITICLITFCNVQAQNSDYANRMQYVFGNIDQTKVTTGYLKEFGIRFANMEACNGSLSANNFVTKSEFQSLYNSLYSMRVGQVASTMDSPQNIYNQNKSQQENTNDILIAVQHFTYQQYKTNAHTNGDVIINNDRIYDVAGRNPYNTRTMFAITPLKQNIQGSTFTYKLPSNLLYSNSNLTINQIQIDYGNGQGYQTVSQNQSKSITYNSGGEKVIKVKFSSSNGTTLRSHSKIWLDYIAPSQSIQKNFDGTGGDMLWNNNIISGSNWNSSSATGRVTIELAPEHTELTKPLIVIEGFDPDDSFDYVSLINGIGPGGLRVPINPATGLTLNEAIEDEDYDLVFVDFVNGTDFIQRNAYMVEEVIRQVNQLKVGNEKNVVLGMSMGGLVGRYALRHMEMEGGTHDTKLYISHDSPHQGANVPLSAQAMVRHLIGEEVSLPVFFSLFDVDVVDMQELIPEIQEGLDLLNSPAAKQMLIYQLQGTGDNLSIDNNSLFQSFKTEYSNMGYPQQNNIRNIAIANGSECGTPLDFEPFDQILDYNINEDGGYVLSYITYILNVLSYNPLKIFSSLLSTDTDIKGNFTLNALPSLQSKQIYRGRLYIEKEVLWVIDIHEPLIDEETVNSSSSMLALDNASGGIYDIEDFAELPDDLDEFLLQRRFSFIPTFSSLDVGSGNETISPIDLSKVYNPLSPPSAPKDVPFNNFFTNPITSQGHIQFTLNNGNWLVSELNGNPSVESCLFACGNSVEISGVSQFCTGTRTFSVTAGADTYQWQLFSDPIPMDDNPLNGNVSIVSGSNTNSITISHTGNMSGWYNLRVNINSVRCNVENLILTKRVYIGAPTVDSITVANDPNGAHLSLAQTPFSCEVPLRLDFVPNNIDVTAIEWEKITTDVDWSRDFMDYPDRYVYLFPDCNKKFEFRVRAKNSCGFWSPWRELSYDITECSSACQSPSGSINSDNFHLYPVPANNILNFNVQPDNTWNFPSSSPFVNLNDLSADPTIDTSGQITYPKVGLFVSFYNSMGVL